MKKMKSWQFSTKPQEKLIRNICFIKCFSKLSSHLILVVRKYQSHYFIWFHRSDIYSGYNFILKICYFIGVGLKNIANTKKVIEGVVQNSLNVFLNVFEVKNK